jgi:hypothetical protein
VPTPTPVDPELRPDPLKPRPVLFKVLGVVFALWVAFLVALYFKTVYPRHSSAPSPDAQGALRPETQPAPGP